ncbi:hypothetical protein [Halorussus marinus]|uniref:hypothetical protein n=1 Tax=Halorussus marinus TaxID=2505976 RepID=UPI00106E911D|nr:hypothetical protein [Halorussus marinus]
MELDSSFESDLREAVLNDVHDTLIGTDGLAEGVQTHAHGLLRAYGQRHDYDVGTLIDAGTLEVDRQPGRVVARWGWPEPAIYFERGTVDHEVHAKSADVLSFVWTDPPQWVREEFEPEGDGYRVFLPEVEVEGLPESRFIRDTLHWLRRRLS